MNSIIKEIHSEFSNAEEVLLTEIENHLARAAEVDKEKINTLSSLGFANFKEVREIQPEEIARVKKLQETVKKFSVINPLYKFITDDKVVEICQKYGLVHAPVELYTDSIPRKNQEEILQFNNWAEKHPELLPNVMLKEHNMKWENNEIRNMTTAHILNTINWVTFRWMDIVRSDTNPKQENGWPSKEIDLKYSTLFCCFLRELFKRGFIKEQYFINYYENNGLYFVCDSRVLSELKISNVNITATQKMAIYSANSFDDNFVIIECLQGQFFILKNAVQMFLKELVPQPEYSIVAAKHMVNLTNHEVTDKYKVIERVENVPMPELKFFKDDDPIVLFRVDGGYYIASAWGDEASDENIVNHQMN